MKAVVRQLVPPVLWELAARLRRSLPGPNLAPVDPRRQSLEAAHQALNAGCDHDEFVLRPGLSMRIHPESRGGFEHFCFLAPEMVDEMDAFLRLTHSRSRLLDVGALHGVFSLAFSLRREGRQAFAVDASPIAFARLLYNVHKNKLDDIFPVEVALSDRNGHLSMHYEWEHAVADTRTENQPGLLLPAMTGDELCRLHDYAPDVIKIDVEGHELKVLQGLAKTIAFCAPDIFLEIHPSRIAAGGDSLVDLADFFAARGYQAMLPQGAVMPLTDIAGLTHDQRVVLTKGP